MPGPLAKTSFEVVRAAIRPNIDRIKAFSEKARRKKGSKNLKNEEEIVLVCVRIAKVIEVFGEATAVLDVFENDDEILSVDGLVVAVACRRMQGVRGKIH